MDAVINEENVEGVTVEGPSGGTLGETEHKCTSWFPLPKLVCKVCKQVIEREDCYSHLDECCFKEESNQSLVMSFLDDGKYLLLEVSAFDGVMKFDVAFPMISTFADLEKKLRHFWMEPCCGHIGHFTYDENIEVSSEPDYETPLLSTVYLPFSTKLKSLFTWKQKSIEMATYRRFGGFDKSKGRTILYEYDMGSTTEAFITLKGKKLLKPGLQIPKAGKILTQNQKPKIKCTRCDKDAKFLREPITEYPKNEVYCSKRCCELARENTDNPYEEPMISVLHNSPRSGTCGYRGLWNPAC